MATSDDKLPIDFTSHCAGRYQLDLPEDIRQVSSSYSDGTIRISTYAADNHEQRYGALRGKERLKQWQDYVESKRLEDEELEVITRYVTQDLKPQLKTLTYYADDRQLASAPNAEHHYIGFFFKDFPEHDIGLMINGSGGIFIARQETNHLAIAKQQVEAMRQQADRVEYALWPHKKPGICLDKEFTVVTNQLSVKEWYGMQFYNGKNSRIEISVRAFAVGDEDYLKKTIGESTGLTSIFASSKTKVAGREGRLFISDDRYSPTARQFRWISTDSKTGSVPLAHIEIEGAIDMKDYPQMAPMNGTDVIVGILKFVRLRDNGMTGTQ